MLYEWFFLSLLEVMKIFVSKLAIVQLLGLETANAVGLSFLRKQGKRELPPTFRIVYGKVSNYYFSYASGSLVNTVDTQVQKEKIPW